MVIHVIEAVLTSRVVNSTGMKVLVYIGETKLDKQKELDKNLLPHTVSLILTHLQSMRVVPFYLLILFTQVPL